MTSILRNYATVLATIAGTFFLGAAPLIADDDSARLPALEKVWEPHDLNRPKPPVRDPGPGTEKEFAKPPGDAVLLFNGKDLSEWVRRPGAKEQPPVTEPKWRIGDGYFEVVKNSGNIYTREKFGEWQSYDITLEQPRFDADCKMTKPCTLTVIHNGVLVQDYVPIRGAATSGTLGLQDHYTPVRFRNIWVQRITPPESKTP